MQRTKSKSTDITFFSFYSFLTKISFLVIKDHSNTLIQLELYYLYLSIKTPEQSIFPRKQDIFNSNYNKVLPD